jgi:hypothetical protein
VEVVEVRVATFENARAEVYQSAKRSDQGGQRVWGQDVNGEDVRESIDGLDAPGLSVADARVADHGVTVSESVGLLGDLWVISMLAKSPTTCSAAGSTRRASPAR